MMPILKQAAAVLAAVLAAAAPAADQQIESELVLITPVAKTLTDPSLAEFAKYAKEKWNVTVKTSALAAGTPVAYGQIVEWKGRPQADIFWGGESALFDKLAEQNLLANSCSGRSDDREGEGWVGKALEIGNRGQDLVSNDQYDPHPQAEQQRQNQPAAPTRPGPVNA